MAELNHHTAKQQNLTKEEIAARIRLILPDPRNRYGIIYLGLFGSYVHGKANQASDLDILVDFQKAPTLFQFVRLQEELADLLGLPVDLVMKRSLKSVIGDQILTEVVPI